MRQYSLNEMEKKKNINLNQRRAEKRNGKKSKRDERPLQVKRTLEMEQDRRSAEARVEPIKEAHRITASIKQENSQLIKATTTARHPKYTCSHYLKSEPVAFGRPLCRGDARRFPPRKFTSATKNQKKKQQIYDFLRVLAELFAFATNF